MLGRLRAERTDTMAELRDWARRLHRHGTHPCDALRRYSIGVYQLYQAIDWKGTPSELESYAAAGIHILAAAEAFDIPTEECSSDTRIVDIPFGPSSDTRLLYLISKLQSQLVYATNQATIKRKSRFERGLAGNLAGQLVRELLSRIPPQKRVQAIYEAMEIMTGEL